MDSSIWLSADKFGTDLLLNEYDSFFLLLLDMIIYKLKIIISLHYIKQSTLSRRVPSWRSTPAPQLFSPAVVVVAFVAVVGVFHHAHLRVRLGLSVGEGISHRVRGEVHPAPAPTLPHLVPHIG
jgi:hypothetical protein